MNWFRRFAITTWQPVLFYGLGAAVLVSIIGYQLGNMPLHLSGQELNAVHAAGNWHTILNNPLYAPHKIVLLLLQLLNFDNLAALRAVSAGWAIMTILLFFSALRHWFTKRIAIIGCLLLATSTWFLVAARSTTPEIMQTGLVALLAIGGWLRYSRARVIPILVGVGLTALLCYIPGMIWFMLLAAVWQRRTLRSSFDETPSVITLLAAGLLVILVAPLLYALIRSPQLIQTLFGLPTHLLSWQQLGRNALDVPLALFVRAPLNPSHWLGHVPLLDIFSNAMFALGLYSFFYRRQLDRAKVLTGIVLLVSILIALGGGITLTMLLPAVYIIIAAGVNLMLQQWLTVFPRNPLARGIGMSLMLLAVLLVSFYQLDRYYQAWQHAPQTKQTYNLNL